MTATQHDPGTAVTGRRWPRWAAPVAVAGAALGAGAYVAAVDPSGGAYLPCPFHALTGLWCPGCGMTRALHHLLTGDLPGALSRNLLLPVVLVLAVWAWAAWLLGRLGRPARGPASLPWAVWVVGGAGALVFALLRNLPAGAALAP